MVSLNSNFFKLRTLTIESVEGATLHLEGVDDIYGSDNLKTREEKANRRVQTV